MSTLSLIEFRKARKMSQAKLGALVGVQDSAIAKWEKKRVPAERVPSLSEVTGIPPHELRPDLYRAPDRPPRDIHADVSGVSGDV